MSESRFPAAEKAIRLAFFMRGYELACVEFYGARGETVRVVLDNGSEIQGGVPEIMRAPLALPDRFTGELRAKMREFQARYSK